MVTETLLFNVAFEQSIRNQHKAEIGFGFWSRIIVLVVAFSPEGKIVEPKSQMSKWKQFVKFLRTIKVYSYMRLNESLKVNNLAILSF